MSSLEHPLRVSEVENEVDTNSFKSFAHQLDLLLRQNVSQCVAQSERFRLLGKEKKKRIMEAITEKRKRSLQIGRAMSCEIMDDEGNNQEVLAAISSQFAKECTKLMQQEWVFYKNSLLISLCSFAYLRSKLSYVSQPSITTTASNSKWFSASEIIK